MPKQETFLSYSIDELIKLYTTLMDQKQIQLKDKVKIIDRCLELKAI